MKRKLPELSLVIPAYNCEGTIVESLSNVASVFRERGLRSEVIVVDDGSDDRTAKWAGEFCRLHRDFRLLKTSGNKGKFAALRMGMAKTQGSVVAFTDADIPFSWESFFRAFDHVRNHGFDIVVGNRRLAESDYVTKLRPIRKITTMAFSYLISFLFSDLAEDTQCGMKFFRGDVGRALFAQTVEQGFAGDVEVLFRARQNGFSIGEVPVQLTRRSPSSVRVVAHTWDMLRAVVRIKVRSIRNSRKPADG